MSRSSLVRSACLLILLSAVMQAVEAQACTIDNVASLSADGVPALLVTTPPSATGGPWAPFVFAQAVAPHVPVRLAEAHTDLVRSLPAAVWAAPFRWTFGDGTSVLGHTVVHRYTHLGNFHLLVYGYYPSERRWFVFDSAVIRVVPANQLFQANLEYAVLRTVLALVPFTLLVDGVLIVVVLVLLARLHRQLHVKQASSSVICTGHAGTRRTR